jgi:hypothetical protein
MPQNGNSNFRGTGGGGWGGSGGANNHDVGGVGSTFYNYTPYGTGGGGIFDAEDGPGSGGGGSHGYGMMNVGNNSYDTGMATFASGQWQSVFPNKGGGGDYFGFITGGNPTSGSTNFGVAAQSQGFVPESYFDIVNLSLKGTGGYGMNASPFNKATIGGNGGPGSGGGGVIAGTGGAMGGTGGTGGGGGGAYATGQFIIGGNGGFGGGGGGAANGGSSNPHFAGKGGPGGGGGGAAYSSVGSGSAIGGMGGVGCVMVFWKG